MKFRDRNYILFDLDGTITESGEGILKGIKYSMEKMGLMNLCENETVLNKFIGPPLKWSYMNLFHMDEMSSDKAIEYFREYYETKGSLYENRLYDGIVSLFDELVACGKKLILATSKPKQTAISVIKHFDIEKYFYFIGTADLETGRMEKTEVIAYVMEHCREITPLNSVMIGDRVYDVEGSREFNLDCIAVAYGYADDEELVKAKPKAIADTVGDLKNLLLY